MQNAAEDDECHSLVTGLYCNTVYSESIIFVCNGDYVCSTLISVQYRSSLI